MRRISSKDAAFITACSIVVRPGGAIDRGQCGADIHDLRLARS
jgi:hypothetical protein